MEIKLKGPMAIVAIAVVLAFLGYRAVAARTVLEGEQGELLKSHLQGVYSGQRLPGLKTALAAGQQDAIAQEVGGLVRLADIEFTDVRVKGLGEDAIVRVTISVAGGEPPDGRAVRYFRLEHNPFGGWRVEGEVTAVSYYLRLF